MALSDDVIAASLRAHGLRVTPQRRAILSAFAGGQTEHLTADDVHERCRAALPDLGRGTVYATLSELTRLGLLRTLGRADPVRYETHVGEHSHFRCLHCGRVYDMDLDEASPVRRRLQGFVVERVHIELEGTCAACGAFADGLRRAVRAAQSRATEALAKLPSATIDTPVGTLALAASERGLARLAFEDHADAAALIERAGRAHRGTAAQRQLDATRRALERYFSPARAQPTCDVDWDAVPLAMQPPLRATVGIAVGEQRAYTGLMSGTVETTSSRVIGTALGANPMPIVLPCHRVVRGDGELVAYTGGLERKQALLAHERPAVAD
jgi:methylated-DNA-[protein]-cysteine S-methyltransferase